MLLCLNNLTFAPEKKMPRPAQNDYHAYFNWNTDITPLEASSASIPRDKFNFTELETLQLLTPTPTLTLLVTSVNITSVESQTVLKSPNISLLLFADVVGVLTSHTNLQQFKRNSGNASFMRELTLENLSGMKIKVTLWGDSTSELTRNLEAHELNPWPVVAVVAGVYVKQYLGTQILQINFYVSFM